MTIAIGSDHGGFKLKEEIKKYLLKDNVEIKDFGTNSEESCDYADFAYPVALEVAKNNFDRGILVCGSGVGVTITANRVKGIRAVNAYNEDIAKQSREHGDCNVLCLGGRYLSFNQAKKIIDVWLNTPFSNDERHVRRIKKIDQ
ncbi:MAG: ribose 5-phosphate isomerase B [Candidatus Saganbacteria bacterium]|uniref:Ribose 5-phosphate isomerase B n=1 Tax=Candidatus Saganbacteria bacterium TaxID=2575572 RepID=A0A833KZS1_UNCSA|nr:MAG: ribose 5-phosphate isomerase B [Candidatus Saganbacteria bacterium]